MTIKPYFSMRSVVLSISILAATALQLPHKLPPKRPRRQLIRRQGWFDGLAKAFENDEQYSSTAQKSPQQTPTVELQGTEWALSLNLIGIPNSDPSSDLYGPKRRIQDALEGTELRISVTLESDASCTLSASEFTGSSPISGKWQVDQQQGGATLALSFECQGFARKFVTKGSLQSVFGGEETERTSSSYRIPSGVCLLRAPLKISQLGSVRLEEGKIFSPVTTGWAAAPTWKQAGTLTATPTLKTASAV